MAQTIQLRHDTAANWASVNPILAQAEIGIELITNKQKIGDGLLHWNDLPYSGIGPQGPPGAKGDTGTGLSRQLATNIDFGTIQGENQYAELIVADALILSTSVIIIQITEPVFILQNVQCAVLSITQGVGYTLYAMAPDGATGIMSINILIF
jgi:hypothetical protein